MALRRRPVFTQPTRLYYQYRFALRVVAIALLVPTEVLLPAAWAQTQRVPPTSLSDVRPSYAPIVARVAPAVVNVYAGRLVDNRFFGADDFFRRFFGPEFNLPRGQMQRSLGSGVIVDPAGLVVTNFHVIDGADEIKVSLADKREFEAEVVLKDARTDLAVLTLKDVRERFPVVEFGSSDDLQVGDVVLAIGNPFGVGQTVTHGIISALARTQVGITDYQFFIQTDAAINPGNSGGPLVDMNGRMVGINTAIFSRSGGSQGIGFAIPVDMVKIVVASAKSGGAAVRRPWLGAKLQAITQEMVSSLGLRRPAGALVVSVIRDSPAARAGLQTRDVIVSIDGQAVDDPAAFEYRFATRPLGRTAQLGVVRNGREIRLTIALEAAPAGPRDEIRIGRSPLGGARVATLSPALADELQLDPATEGVVIVDVAAGSTAAAAGFRRGDVLLGINGERVKTAADVDRATQNPTRLWRFNFVRDRQQIQAVFGG
ncbi:MAG TPA: DegQ family serine endoprotease [Xanthobacteraceae bacterium]|nr:DegQ family serine endoprotease [Xanthobacteraceae bacterium]